MSTVNAAVGEVDLTLILPPDSPAVDSDDRTRIESPQWQLASAIIEPPPEFATVEDDDSRAVETPDGEQLNCGLQMSDTSCCRNCSSVGGKQAAVADVVVNSVYCIEVVVS